jgi:hypothetical protein
MSCGPCAPRGTNRLKPLVACKRDPAGAQHASFGYCIVRFVERHDHAMHGRIAQCERMRLSDETARAGGITRRCHRPWIGVVR